MENAPSPLFNIVDGLLAPMPGDNPAGPSARYDPVFSEIRVAREADDPSLPQGEWERPLKKADWPLVTKLCIQTLSERSKDLQIAAWLTEAWIHLYQVDGLRAGIRLVQGLLDAHWDGVHPRQSDDGDYEARVAPLAWLNETLPLTLRLNVGLLPWPDRKPAFISLEDWTKAPLVAQPKPDGDDEPNPAATPSRDELMLVGAASAAPQLLQLRQALARAAAEWKALDALIDSRLGNESPSLSRVADTLALIDRAITSLLSKREERPTPLARPPLEATVDAEPAEKADTVPAETVSPEVKEAFEPSDLRLATVPIRSRADAYRQLEGIANFLQSIEPHSPTPYLVRRAVSWGRMPLPELMQEVLREEGDLNRLFKVLGLKPDKA
jgi:type VI secretion system protein ImpA